MNVFKFGGASVKDAAGVQNVGNVLRHFPTRRSRHRRERDGQDDQRTRRGRLGVSGGPPDGGAAGSAADRTCRGPDRGGPGHREAMADLARDFAALERILQRAPSDNVDRDYDQIVSLGEIWSTRIVSAFLDAAGSQTPGRMPARSSPPTICTAARGSIGLCRPSALRRRGRRLPTIRGGC